MKTLKMVRVLACTAMLTLVSLGPQTTFAQQLDNGLGQQIYVDADTRQIQVVVGASRRLKFSYKIPELVVENPDVVKATPVAPTEILISGLVPGITTITVSDPAKNQQDITIQVTADTRKLEASLRQHFPESTVKVHALQTGVMLTGTVARADHVETIMAIARDYFPAQVINQMSVDGSQVVAIKVKVYEVNRSKLRTLGIDWAIFGDDFGIGSSVSNIIQTFSPNGGTLTTSGDETISFGVFGNNTSFFKFFEALEQNNLAKLLDQPTLVAQNGRPAEFLSGGEIPIAIAAGLGTNAIEFRAFGTKLDMVPLIHGQGELTLEVRAEVSEVDNSLSFGSGVPGFRVRRVNTGVRMRAGHTLALAGDYREDVETEKRGIPVLMHAPLIGQAFRRNTESVSESELVFLITPRFISDVDPSMMPRLGPGQLTTSPSDHELFNQGYLEVPRCHDDCPTLDRFDDPANFDAYPNYPMSLDQRNGQQGIGNQMPIDQNGNGQFVNPQNGGQFQPVPYQHQQPAGINGPVGNYGDTGNATQGLYLPPNGQ